MQKVLIANRGEIAIRVINTCRKLGINTVAVHSDVDTKCLHVRRADESVLLGTALSSDSYLKQDRLIQAVKETGATGLHPG